MLFIEVLECHSERIAEILHSCETYYTVSTKQFIAGDAVATFNIATDIVNDLDIPEEVWRICGKAGYPIRMINTTSEDNYCVFIRYAEAADPIRKKITHKIFRYAVAKSKGPKNIFHHKPEITQVWIHPHTFWVNQEPYYKEHSFNKLVRLV